jgi:hypothetical protein
LASGRTNRVRRDICRVPHVVSTGRLDSHRACERSPAGCFHDCSRGRYNPLHPVVQFEAWQSSKIRFDSNRIMVSRQQPRNYPLPLCFFCLSLTFDHPISDGVARFLQSIATTIVSIVKLKQLPPEPKALVCAPSRAITNPPHNTGLRLWTLGRSSMEGDRPHEIERYETLPKELRGTITIRRVVLRRQRSGGYREWEILPGHRVNRRSRMAGVARGLFVFRSARRSQNRNP